MEIKSIPEIIKEMDSLVKEEKYDEAFQFAKENINLNKEYAEGEYVFKNLLEEILFQITINNEIKRKYPLILDYSTLYSNYGNVLLHFNEYEDALKSFRLEELERKREMKDGREKKVGKGRRKRGKGERERKGREPERQR